jgi:hypothetical protein
VSLSRAPLQMQSGFNFDEEESLKEGGYTTMNYSRKSVLSQWPNAAKSCRKINKMKIKNICCLGAG